MHEWEYGVAITGDGLKWRVVAPHTPVSEFDSLMSALNYLGGFGYDFVVEPLSAPNTLVFKRPKQ
jgi:hypothetical protein